MSADRLRRIDRLEKRRATTEPRFVVLHGEATRVAWAKPNGDAIVVLPHNGRDPLPGALV